MHRPCQHEQVTSQLWYYHNLGRLRSCSSYTLRDSTALNDTRESSYPLEVSKRYLKNILLSFVASGQNRTDLCWLMKPVRYLTSPPQFYYLTLDRINILLIPRVSQIKDFVCGQSLFILNLRIGARYFCRALKQAVTSSTLKVAGYRLTYSMKIEYLRI